MARVFPMEDWAAAQEARPSTTNSFFSANYKSPVDTKTPNSRSMFRKRLQSLPLINNEKDDEFQSRTFDMGSENTFSKESNTSRGNERKVGGLRGLWKRASCSVSLGRRQRQAIEEQERPQTAWTRLKRAASFSTQRHSRFLSHNFDAEDSMVVQEEIVAPVPGNGSAPPIIPLGSGGAAARATAAAQNEYWNRQLLDIADENLEDRESGIGIAVTMVDIDSEEDEDESTANSFMNRVDFMVNLPAELAFQILGSLDVETLRNVAEVSLKWRDLSNSQHVWREVFLRDQTKTYATSNPITLGAGLGLPYFDPDINWKELYGIREQLARNWLHGSAEAIYLSGHLDSIYCVQFDENKIITGSRDKTIRVWDMRTYNCTLVIGPPAVINNGSLMTAEDGSSQHYALFPDCKRYAECTPKTATFDMYHSASILCLQYDENILVTGSSDHTCIVYDIKKGYKPIMRLQHHTAAVLDLAFDDKHIVTCSKDVTICIWDRETGVMLKQLKGHTGPVNAVQMRDNTVVSCSGDFKVKLWNIDTGKNIKELSGHTKGLACSQFSEDSRFIASAGNDRIIRIWDANTGECLRSIQAHDNLVRSLHIDSISGRLISGSYDQDIKVFDMASGSLLLDFPKWHSSWVLGAKSDYRRIISTGQDPKILIMDFGMTVKGIEKLESQKKVKSRDGLLSLLDGQMRNMSLAD